MSAYDQILERFERKSPFAVLVRSILQRLLPPDQLDRLFEQTAVKQDRHGEVREKPTRSEKESNENLRSESQSRFHVQDTPRTQKRRKITPSKPWPEGVEFETPDTPLFANAPFR